MAEVNINENNTRKEKKYKLQMYANLKSNFIPDGFSEYALWSRFQCASQSDVLSDSLRVIIITQTS